MMVGWARFCAHPDTKPRGQTINLSAHPALFSENKFTLGMVVWIQDAYLTPQPRGKLRYDSAHDSRYQLRPPCPQPVRGMAPMLADETLRGFPAAAGRTRRGHVAVWLRRQTLS